MSKPAPWNQSDSTALRAYLGENPKLLETLRAKRPKLEGNTLEQAAMNAKLAEGYEEMVRHLEELAEPRKEEAALPAFVDNVTD